MISIFKSYFIGYAAVLDDLHPPNPIHEKNSDMLLVKEELSIGITRENIDRL